MKKILFIMLLIGAPFAEEIRLMYKGVVSDIKITSATTDKICFIVFTDRNKYELSTNCVSTLNIGDSLFQYVIIKRGEQTKIRYGARNTLCLFSEEK